MGIVIKELKKKLLTVPEAVELFPVPISPATLYRWSREGRLRSQRVGSKVFISPDAIAEFLQSGQQDEQASN